MAFRQFAPQQLQQPRSRFLQRGKEQVPLVVKNRRLADLPADDLPEEEIFILKPPLTAAEQQRLFFAWLEEMQIFFFVWTIYFGGSVAFRTGNQVSIDLIAARLKPGARRILDLIDYVITMVVLFYLTYGG